MKNPRRQFWTIFILPEAEEGTAMDVDFVVWPHNPNFVRRMAEAGRKR